MALENVYVAIDVETTGPRLGVDSMLSLGACVVTRAPLAVGKLEGLTFYAELKPTSLNYIPQALRIGASQLGTLKSKAMDPHFCPSNQFFEPKQVLTYLQDSELCDFPATAMRQFADWLKKVSYLKDLVPVVDTTFFDSGWVNYYFARAEIDSPLGHKGIDLASLWIGATNDLGARLKTVGVSCDDLVQHHALHDAVCTARLARAVFDGKKWGSLAA